MTVLANAVQNAGRLGAARSELNASRAPQRRFRVFWVGFFGELSTQDTREALANCCAIVKVTDSNGIDFVRAFAGPLLPDVCVLAKVDTRLQ